MKARNIICKYIPHIVARRKRAQMVRGGTNCPRPRRLPTQQKANAEVGNSTAVAQTISMIKVSIKGRPSPENRWKNEELLFGRCIIFPFLFFLLSSFFFPSLVHPPARLRSSNEPSWTHLISKSELDKPDYFVRALE